MKPGRAVASFDSASGMLRALAHFLHGRDNPALGQAPRSWEPPLSMLLGGVNRLPARWAEQIYAASGVAESIPPGRVGELDSDELASWVVSHYPRRRYPVLFLGSSNGALVHLAAALDAAWLPQTLLIPVRRSGIDRDDPQAEKEAGERPGRALVERNPQLQLHHMHDPNQDRLMIAGMSYFRVKWRGLPEAYRRFIAECLEPDGVLVSVECELSWPATTVGQRHVFQFGALGGAEVREYYRGGPRVASLLGRTGSSRQSWDPPEPGVHSPEAEWGFEPAILGDVRTLMGEHGGDFRRLRFPEPEALSGPVADLYREWYAQRGVPAGRLLVESFLLLDPWLALRTGSVPFWMAFNTEESHRALREYLERSAAYDEIRMMLFSHGIESIGLAHIEQWQQLLERGRKIGTLLGVDRRAYPRDFASLVRAHRELSRMRTVYPMPRSLSPGPAEGMLRGHPAVRCEAA